MNTNFEMIELSLQQEEEEQTTEIYVSMMSMIRSKWVTAMPSSDVMDLDEEVNEELGALDSEENNYNEDNSENENESNDKLAKPTIEEFTKKLASNNKENEKTLKYRKYNQEQIKEFICLITEMVSCKRCSFTNWYRFKFSLPFPKTMDGRGEDT
ncbi:hypothetical protein G6F61_006174 [Rhizopus arrhizus]|nr:hypothetical protein G6F61_006174 [Rhizopus arrhizus]